MGPAPAHLPASKRLRRWATAAFILNLASGVLYLAILGDPHPSLIVLFLAPAAAAALALAGTIVGADSTPAGAAVLWQGILLPPLMLVTWLTALVTYAPGFGLQVYVWRATVGERRESGSA